MIKYMMQDLFLQQKILESQN